MKSAIDQARPNSRTLLDYVDKLTNDEINDANRQGTFDARRHVIIMVIANKRNGNEDMSELLCIPKASTWPIFSAQAEGEAEEKLESCTQRD